MKRILPCSVLAFAVRASGQTTYQPPPLEPAIPTAQNNLPNTLPGVVIESWRYDPSQKAVILHLVNRSISIVEKYADGSISYLDGDAE